MVPRPFWQQRLADAWRQAPIVWLCGVRRCGKTTLANSLGAEEVAYLNCDLPSVAEQLRDPELWLGDCRQRIVVLDEVHQLPDPTRVLKIAADEFPSLRVLATGSSTLAASAKFRDTLTGRKRTVHLTPVGWDELPAFGVSLARRLLQGGLPPALLAAAKDPSFYREWLDSFFARDIQRLFGFRDMNRFNALFEYLLRQSGGLMATSRTATAVGVTRPTVESHLRALEATHAATIVRPFAAHGHGELVKEPKVYAFDTGFVSYARGWDPLRSDDHGVLWEHLVLEHLQACFPDRTAQFWRDKQGHEVDFVLSAGRDSVDAIECKWSPAEFDAKGLSAFRSRYPAGRNYVVSPSVKTAFRRRFGGLEVMVCSPSHLQPGPTPHAPSEQ